MEVNMDKKTTGIIATVATVLLCGCPGLGSLCYGLMTTVVSFIPGAQIDIFGSSDAGSATTMGIVTLCVGVIFVAIPIVVGILTLRKKPQDAVSVEDPLPPAI
jgi:preprotein translocase subunit SecG